MRVRNPLLAVLLVLAAGCRTAWPAPPTEEERAAFGGIAVVVSPEVDAGQSPPVTGWAAGLGFGVLRGIGAILVFASYGAQAGSGGGRDDGNLVGAVGLLLGTAVGVAYFPVSVVSGAVNAADPDEISRAEAVVAPIFADPELPAPFARRFESAAGRGFVPRPEAETVVELRLEKVTGGSDWDLFTIDRPFEIRVKASARVVRASDGLVVWEAVREAWSSLDEGERRTYAGWAEDDGLRLRREIETAVDRLAEGFAWSIFVQGKGEEPPPHLLGGP